MMRTGLDVLHMLVHRVARRHLWPQGRPGELVEQLSIDVREVLMSLTSDDAAGDVLGVLYGPHLPDVGPSYARDVKLAFDRDVLRIDARTLRRKYV